MTILSPLNNLGLSVARIHARKIRIKGLSALSSGELAFAIDYAKQHKPEILQALEENEKKAPLSLKDECGDCDTCPAAGYWDYSSYGGKMQCFYYAYFLGKSERPIPCEIAKRKCPKKY